MIFTAHPPVKKHVLKEESAQAQLQFSLHDKAHCSMPGLFTSLPKSKEGPKDYSLLPYQHGEVTLSVKGAQLSVFDGRVLQVLVALAGKNKILKETDDGHCLYIPDINLAEMCRELGMSYENRSVNSISASLSHLHQVKLTYQYTDQERFSRAGNRLIDRKTLETGIIYRIERLETEYETLSEGQNKERIVKKVVKINSISVLLNQRIAEVVMNSHKAGYVRIELKEARELSDSAWAIHQRLCAFVDPGKISFPIHVDTLCEYAWGSSAGLTEIAYRKRRSLARKAAAEFIGIKWKVLEDKKKFIFERPSLATNEANV